MFGRMFGLRASGGKPGVLRAGVAIWAAAAIVGACGGTAATPSPTSTPSPTITASPTPVPTPTPIPTVLEYAMAMGDAPLAPAASDQGAASALEINDFGLDLLRRLDANGNLCASPTSIALALGMVRPGARGTTAAQMDAVLNSFGAPGQDGQIVALLQQLRGQTMYIDADGAPLPDTATPDPANPDPAIELTVANQLFSQQGMALEPAYLNALSSTYGAGAGLLDFQNDPESARLTINKWANDNTRGRIPNVLQPGDIQPATRIALANAIYLKSNWGVKFDPTKTKPAAFTTASGPVISVPTMAIRMTYQYGSGAGYRMVDLPLEMGSSMSVTVLVPDNMTTFLAGLDGAKFKTMVGNMTVHDVNLWLPRFSAESRVDLADVLQAMGMSALFDSGAADLSGITTEQQLYVDKVIHQANIDVDEVGVTAAAVTVVSGLGGAGEPPPHVDFHVDKPFLYFVRERKSGVILFVGRIGDPSAAS
jgi:serpin B